MMMMMMMSVVARLVGPTLAITAVSVSHASTAGGTRVSVGLGLRVLAVSIRPVPQFNPRRPAPLTVNQGNA